MTSPDAEAEEAAVEEPVADPAPALVQAQLRAMAELAERERNAIDYARRCAALSTAIQVCSEAGDLDPNTVLRAARGFHAFLIGDPPTVH